MLTGLTRRFRSADDATRAGHHGLALAIAAYLVIYGLYSQWYIEDAAIVFAYARNAADGLGFVPWPGGERVEGFSDPLWTLLLTALACLWVSPWIGVKVLGAALGVATLVGVSRWARLLVPDPRFGAAAAALLAVHPQFAAWNASGLENPLLGWLVVWGSLAVLEGRPGVVAGVWWGLVAITRPEGVIYGAVAGVVGALAAGKRAPGWSAGFALGLALPVAGWMAVKVPYFAWPLPNTYYAKLGESRASVLGWASPGWEYLRDWALRTGYGFVFPVFVLGFAGTHRRRAVVAGAYAALAMFLWIPGLAWTTEIPGWPFADRPAWALARVLALGAGFAALPLLGFGRPGWAARLLAGWIVGAGVFFAVYSGGDWMVGFRWMALPAIGVAILLADAVWTWAPRLPPGALAVAGVGVGGVVIGAGGAEIARYVRSADTSPFDVHDRVRHHERVARKLALELPPRLADVDMGAHLWWYRSPVLDYAGLVDVPFAQHRYEPRFLDEYVYRELVPEVIHVHGNWTSRSRLRSRPGFAQYVEIPGYRQSRTNLHEGSAVRRELLTRPFVAPEGRSARFAAANGAVDLVGWEVAPVSAPGGALALRTAWRRVGRGVPFQVVAFLADADGVRAAWELPPAHGWLPAERWRPGEVIATRHLPALPSDLPPGVYDLGIAVLGWSTGGAAPPRFARGERVFPRAVTVAPAADVQARGLALAAEVRARAAAGDCEGARESRRALDDLAPVGDALRVEVALCYAAKGAFGLAVRWAPEDREVRAGGRAHAERREEAGDAALRAGDEAGAHAAWTEAIDADPERAWLRRKLEALRRERLDLDRDRAPPPPAEPMDPSVRGG